MGRLQVQGLLHLTSVNPYIMGSLQPARGPGSGKGLQAHLPRGPSGASNLSRGSRWDQVAGISGFAFQGTNAHVVLARYARLAVLRMAMPAWLTACQAARGQWRRQHACTLAPAVSREVTACPTCSSDH